MSKTPEKEAGTIFPDVPPDKLIPRGYTVKVVIMWLSFLGIFIGTACLGGPFAVLLPISSVSFLISLTLLLYGRVKERPLWIYKEARSSFERAQYDKAIRELELIIKLRPDTEGELYPIIAACRIFAGGSKEDGKIS